MTIFFVSPTFIRTGKFLKTFIVVYLPQYQTRMVGTLLRLSVLLAAAHLAGNIVSH